MKFTIALLTVSVLHVSASAIGQTITYSGREVPLEKIFSVIKEQTRYLVFYDYNTLQGSKPVTVSVQKASLQSFLNQVLQRQQLDYSIKKHTIFIKKTIATGLPHSAYSLPQPVVGRITDSTGTPLAGATVTVKGTNKITGTNEKGAFTVEAGIGDVLVVSYVGFATESVAVKERVATLSIVLKPEDSPLDEVQVIAYGTTTKRNNVGNVISVKGEDIAKQPVTNPLAVLEDRVPGLRIVQQTGVSGGTFKVQIRGQNSIVNGNDPLYVIDGVPYTSTLLPSQGYTIFGGSNVATSGNPLNFINMNNIERIDVLKDADATAIYGSRGANGVILITTKKGKAGRMSADLNVNSGIGRVKNRLDYMNTPQYLAMRRQAFANDGITPSKDDAADLFVWDTTRYTNWQNEIFGKTASFSTAQLGISGGSDVTSYNVNAVYSRQTTVFPGNFSDRKVGINFNISGASPNHKLSFLFSGGYTNDNNNPPSSDLTSAIDLAPNAPKIYNSDGSLNYEGNTFFNLFSALKVRYNVKTDNLISNLTVGYQLAKGLEFKTSFGYNSLLLSEIKSVPTAAINPYLAAFVPRNSAFTDNKIKSWIVEPQLTYSGKLWKGNLDALLGATLQTSTSDGQIVVGSGYTSDALLEDLKSAPTIRVESTNSAIYKYDALFGRVTYNLANKYLVNVTARRDGSSRFGPATRFHDFGAIGLGWIFTQEHFLSGFSALSFGKIRASMGWTGNDQIGDYRFLNLYQSYGSPYQNVTGLMLSNLYNPNLQWEVNRKQEIGLELGFLNNRINVSTSFYRNVASNQLITYPLSSVTGFTEIPYNFDAKVQNKGWEFLVTTTNVKKGKFSWTTSANLTIDRNTLLDFPDLANSPYANLLIVGQPISIGKGLSFAGVDPTTGVYQFYDTKGNKTTSPDQVNDRFALINVTPRFYGGLSNRFSSKDITLDFSLQIVKQKGFYDAFVEVPGVTNQNQTTNILAHWEKNGDNVPYQKFTTMYGTDAYNSAMNVRGSDFTVSDASFVRLKNVSISWKIPTEFYRHMRLQGGRVYVQGQNLLTFTKYKGLDPENQSNYNIPPLFMVVGGFQLTF